MCLTSLGLALQFRFECLGKLEDIENAAITVELRAVELAPDGHVDKARCLNNLANVLQRRFERRGQLGDMESAILAQSRAVDLTSDGHVDKPGYLSNLGNIYLREFIRLGKLDSIEDAIVVLRRAADLTAEGHPNKPRCLTNLGNVLRRRFERLGDMNDIENAIVEQRHAVELTPDPDRFKPGRLTNLAIALQRRFEHLGELEDIEDAIVVQRKAIDLTSDRNPEKPTFLCNLGNMLEGRFKQFGEVQDVEDSVTAKRRALELTPTDHPEIPTRLNNLGNALESRFQRLGRLEDIDEAISIKCRAVELTPDGHLAKLGRLNNLAHAFKNRFQRLREISDIDRAIKIQRSVLESTPDIHPGKASRLNNLGNALQYRFECAGELDDIENAILSKRGAVKLTPDGHVDKPTHLTDLGEALYAQFQQTSIAADFEEAFHSFMLAASDSSGSPSIRLRAARACALMCSKVPGIASQEMLLHAHERVLLLIPQVVWLGHSLKRRYNELPEIGEMVHTAAAAAIAAGELTQALEWLEEGRSVVWGQVLQLRTPMDDLRRYHPAIAIRLQRVSVALESTGRYTTAGLLRDDPQIHLRMSMEEEARNRRLLAKEYENLLTQVREFDGFQSFLQPKRFSELSSATANGPIVVINMHESRCDALVLFQTGRIVNIPLPRFSSALAATMHSTLLSSLQSQGVRNRKPIQLAVGGVDHIGQILNNLWTRVVYPVLEVINEQTSCSEGDKLPHVTWCATGPLAFLPLHAAGMYGSKAPAGKNKMFEYAVSSYTPTISSLISTPPNRSELVDHTPPSILVISQSDAEGYSRLPGTKKEERQIRNHFPDRTKSLTGADATIDTVLEALNQHHWVHLACHGIQDSSDPTKSAFVLCDGKLELSQLMTKSMKLAELAFLSACETATGDEKLPEEAVHLTAGMLTIGFKSVVGTMWSIRDEDAPIVADVFYSNLKAAEEEGNGSKLKVAYALHESMKYLRENVGEESFIRWVPFVHFGI
ncbi:TPR-like protein [Dendrothele bispora CBS 962.96]|uniref:TPR-like protein n=1 Tax=Dendrothele bispora (strain CBS 962.96) TaxID=1314807 RepID=A0A4S8L3W4_DENBC|nr:TPR-like protein [Dendrothele bispora CBS 962.96]